VWQLEGDVTGVDAWDYFSDFNMYGVYIQFDTPATSPAQKDPPIHSGWEVNNQGVVVKRQIPIHVSICTLVI